MFLILFSLLPQVLCNFLVNNFKLDSKKLVHENLPFQINQTILAVFDRFISENADRMEDLFNQMDKDKSGAITLEEFKYGLKDFGLRLTSVSV